MQILTRFGVCVSGIGCVWQQRLFTACVDWGVDVLVLCGWHLGQPERRLLMALLRLLLVREMETGDTDSTASFKGGWMLMWWFSKRTCLSMGSFFTSESGGNHLDRSATSAVCASDIFHNIQVAEQSFHFFSGW